MKNIFLLFFIAVIGLTANSYGQGICDSAVSLRNDSNITIPINTNVFWCNVVPENDSMIYIFSTNNDTTALIATINLYKGGCDSLELINTYTVNDSTSFIELFNLHPNNNYFFKVNFNNTLNGNFIMYSIIVPSGTPCPTPASCSLVKNYDFELIRDNINASFAFGSNQVCHWKEAWGTPSWTNAAYLWSYNNNSEAIFQDGMTLQPNIEYTITYDYLLQSVRVNSINVGLTNYPLPNQNLAATNPTALGFSMLDIGTINFQYNAPLNTWYHYSNDFTPNIAYNNLVIYPLYPNHPSITPFVAIDNIVIKPKLIFQNLQNPQTICIGNSTTIQPLVPTANITSWQWTSNPVGFNATTQNITVSPSVNTLYRVVAKDANGCEWIGGYYVLLTTAPNITPLTITSDWGGKPCSEGVSFTFPLPATPGITYTWILPNNATIATTTATNNITVNWNNAGIATVIVEGRNANGCLVYQGSLLVNPNQTFCTATYAINNLNATQIKAMFGGASTITTTQPILINGIITINENINFDACTDIKLGLNAKINVMPGCTLNILNSTLHACDCPWDGIFVENPTARLYITNSSVSGAKNAVVSSYDGKLNLYNSTFTDNQLGVWIRKYNPVPMQDQNGNIIPPAAHSAYIAKCLFISNIKHFINGIRIDTVYNVTIGDVSATTNRNEFYKLDNAITSNFSDVTIYNNYFNNCERSTEPNPYYWYSEPIDAAIFIKRAYGQGMLPNSAIKNEVFIGGTATNQANTFYLQNVGIYAYLSSVYVRNNIFTDQRFSAVHLKELNKSEISFNTITMQTTTWATNNLYNSTILTENVMPLTYAAINVSSNTINNTRTGINVRNCNGDGSVYNYCYILTNNIFFSSTGADPSVAINASSSQYSLIDQNYIKNNMTTIPNYDRMLGIKLATVQNATVKRNQMIRLSSGIWGADNLLGTQFFCNDLDKNYYGFYFLPSYAVISNQGSASSASSNYWYDNASYPTPEMRRMGGGIVLQGGNMVNWYHKGAFNSIPNIQSPYIPISHPLYQYINPVANILFGNRCNIIAPLMNKSQERQEEIGAIVSDATDFQVNPLENEYYAKDFTYRKLDDHTDLLYMNAPDDSVYQNFYYTIKQQGIGKFAEVSKYINNQQYADAALLNEAISPVNNIESQKKTVNAIYLQCIVNNKPISTTDSLTLLNIAMQLPFMGGEAVYSARVILGLDPVSLNLAYSKGPNIPKDNIVISDKLRIYPNPASDVINIVFETATDKESVFELYDFSGKQILSNTIKAKTTVSTINLNAVKAGIYYYKLFTTDEILAKNKLVILNK